MLVVMLSQVGDCIVAGTAYGKVGDSRQGQQTSD